MTKILVQKRTEAAGTPPVLNVGTIADAATIDTETRLIKTVYARHGAGQYTLQISHGSGKLYSVWQGFIRETPKDTILFHANEKNTLHAYTGIKQQTGPSTDPMEVTAPDPAPDAEVHSR